jgi:hypothetical protein
VVRFDREEIGMRSQLAVPALLVAAVLVAPVRADAPSGTAPKPSWRIRGALSEACSCSVPCTCNFGERATPSRSGEGPVGSGCWTVYSLAIRKGHYGSVTLDGLHLAGAKGGKGTVFYLDARATPEQAEALKAIAAFMSGRILKTTAKGAPSDLEDHSGEFLRLKHFLGFKTVPIQQEAGPNGTRLVIGDQGGFESDTIMGIDGKTPVRVENNWSWNIRHGIKGKTKRLQYKDEFGNAFDLTGTNANQGEFDWSDKTPIYFR